MLGIGPFGPLGRDHRVGHAGAAELAGTAGLATGTERAGAAEPPGAAAHATILPLPVASRPTTAQAERDALAVLVSVDGLGPVGLGRLLERLGGAEAIFRAATMPGAEAVLREAGRDGDRGGIGDEIVRRIVRAAGAAEQILGRLRAAGVTTVAITDAAYPARLRSIALPPHVLFVRGDPDSLAADRAVAVVGTRRPTDGGRRLAARIAAVLARAGATVVSGLAIGIDGAAHAAVVAESGPTVAVLGGGHSLLYPRAHGRLAEAIVGAGGAVISEFAPDVPPTPGTFPRRNRLISGLAEATIVVEAAARSGALTTAAWALEQGRGCFLVPGSIDAPMAAGCLAFLRECPGEARIVAGIPQLLEDLGLARQTAPQRPAAHAARGRGGGPDSPAARVRARSHPGAPSDSAVLATVGGTERRVAEGLITGLATVDELCAGLDLPVATVLGTLTLLEGRGLVAGAYGRYRPAGLLASLPVPGQGPISHLGDLDASTPPGRGSA